MEIRGIPTTLRDFVRPASTALVMWDMQKGLAGRASNLEQLSKAAGSLLEAADKAGVLVIWSRQIHPPLDYCTGPKLLFLMKRQGVERPQDLRPVMQAGAEETAFVPGFSPAAHHLVIEKSEPSFFIGTPLELRLRARGIETLVMAGVATEIGIEFTVRHALALGYFAVVAEDATGSFTEDAHNLGLAYLRSAVPVVPADEICRAWSSIG